MRTLGRTKDQIAEEMRQEINSKGYGITDIITNPVAMTHIDTAAHQVEMLEVMAEQIAKRYYISEDTSDGLDKRLSERGMQPRYPGEQAKGNILLGKGSPFVIGSTIQKGTIFKTICGKIELEVTADTNVITGTTSCAVPVKCTTVGTQGNLLPNTELTYSGVAINEVETIKVDASGLTGGKNPELNDEVKARLLDDMRKSVTSNNKNHFVKWAKEVSGVGDALCIPLWNGDNTVKVVILDINKLPASAELVAAVQNYIDPGSSGMGEGQAMFGSFVTVVAAAGININVSATLTIKPGYTIEQVAYLFREALTEYLKSIAFKPDNTVRYTRIGTLIMDTEGALDYSNLTVNGGTANININAGSVAVPGVVTFT